MEDFDISHRAEIFKCIIYNKSVQHMFPDLFRIIKTELNLLSSHIVPPLNIDAIARRERNEWNLMDARNMACKSWFKTEITHLVSTVAGHARGRRIDVLEHQREVLLSRIANSKNIHHPSKISMKDSSHRSSSTADYYLSNSIKQIEQQLTQYRELPAKPPAWLSSAIACAYFHEPGDSSLSTTAGTNQMQNVRREFWERRIFRRYRGPRFIREYTVKLWLDLLFNAEDLLTDAEWEELANHQFRDTTSKENLHLMWIHRVKPNCNLTEWTASEDAQLIALVGRLGQCGQWESIAEELNTGRSAFTCFQRWQMNFNTDFHADRPWTVAEDTELMDILKHLLEKYPPPLIEWNVVASLHKTRTATQCKIRASTVCPSFMHVNTSKLACSDSSRCTRPFSADEDLQLLIAVQRYGTSGGFVGAGGGVGLGSWALVATALPGRSLFTCRRRYVQLCDQFQPWTYSEDKKLYQLLIRHQGLSGMENMIVFQNTRIFPSLLQHFPGRSALSIRERVSTLLRWSSVWSSWRRTVSLFSIDSQFDQDLDVKNGVTESERTPKETCNKTTEVLSELRGVLLQSPFTSQFVAQLKRNGVVDAESEALRLLATWKCNPIIDDRQSTGANEFSGLLEDLASGVLVPRPLVTPSHSSAVASTSAAGFSAQGEAEEQQGGSSSYPSDELDQSGLSTGTPVTLPQAKKMIANFQLKRMLAGPIRSCLTNLLGRWKFHTKRRVGLQSLSSTGEEPPAPTEPGRRLTRFRRVNQEGGTVSQQLSSTNAQWKHCPVASSLLSDSHFFWKVFESAMANQKVVNCLVRSCTVSKLREVAPLISAIMCRYARKILSASSRRLAGYSCIAPCKRYPLQTALQIRRHRQLLFRLAAARNLQLHRRLSSMPTPVQTGIQGRSTSLSLFDREPPWASDQLSVKTSEGTAELRQEAGRLNSHSGPGSTQLIEKAPILASLTKRFKLFHIRRLMILFGKSLLPVSNAYAITPNASQYPKSKLTAVENVVRPNHFCPPLLRALPPDVAAELVTRPELVANRCEDMVSACLSHTLRLPDALKTLTEAAEPPVPTTSAGRGLSSSSSVHVLPPNYATMLAWKSLLVHAPAIARLDDSQYSLLSRLRKISHALASGEDFKKEVVDKWDDAEHLPPLDAVHFTATPNTPADALCTSHGLSMMLLPALLSSIPANTFIDAAVRVWNTAMSELPVNLSSPSAREEVEEGCPGEGDSTPEHRLASKRSRASLANWRLGLRRDSRRTSRVVKRARYCSMQRYCGRGGRMPQVPKRKRPEWKEVVEVSLSSARQAESLKLHLPSEVRLLAELGFQPVSIFHTSST